MSELLLNKYILSTLQQVSETHIMFCIQILVLTLSLILLFACSNFILVLKIMSFNHYIQSHI